MLLSFEMALVGTLTLYLYCSQNPDVYLGYTGWAADGFASTCELTETPAVRWLLDGYSVGQAVHRRGIEITDVKD